MAEVLRPKRGGFLRPFGCGTFIRDFLAREGPNGSPRIDPSVGAPMVDICYEYKSALMQAWADDMVATEEERTARRKLAPFTPEEAERRTAHYLERIPMKFDRVRYSSFTPQGPENLGNLLKDIAQALKSICRGFFGCFDTS